jgi:hypothetical protein
MGTLTRRGLVNAVVRHGETPMGYPKYMTDEQLAVFGFAVSPDNPTFGQRRNAS